MRKGKTELSYSLVALHNISRADYLDTHMYAICINAEQYIRNAFASKRKKKKNRQ